MTDGATIGATFRLKLAVGLLGALLLASCDSDLGESFSDMFEIRDAILELSGAEDVGVHIHNNTLLTVNLVNSPLNDGSAAARRELADRVASAAFAQFRGRDSLERVYVVYVYYERKYVLMTHTRTIDVVEYDAAALRAGGRARTRLTGTRE